MNEVLDYPVFVFPSSEMLSSEQILALLDHTHRFLETWNSHGQPILAEARVEESRFLVVELKGGAASGCSKDKLFRMLEEATGLLGIRFDSSGKFFLEWQDNFIALSRKELNDSMLNAEFLENARLFPTWISSLNEYESLWKKSLSAFPQLFPASRLV
jgi:hypothetical protein